MTEYRVTYLYMLQKKRTTLEVLSDMHSWKVPLTSFQDAILVCIEAYSRIVLSYER